MARNRYDRDENSDRDYYGRDSRADSLRGGDRYSPERGYGRSGSLDRDYGSEDSYGARRGGTNFGEGGRGGYGRDDYGRGGYGAGWDVRQPREERVVPTTGDTRCHRSELCVPSNG